MKFVTLTGQTLEDVQADRFYPLPVVYQIEGTWLGITVGSSPSLGFVRRVGADSWWNVERQLFRQFVKVSNVGSEEAAAEPRNVAAANLSRSPLSLQEALEALSRSPRPSMGAAYLKTRVGRR